MGAGTVARTTSQVELIIRRYQHELNKLGIDVERVLLFGSYAKGTQSDWSDIDLIVISSDWSRYTRRARLETLGLAAARILAPIEAVGFTPDEVREHRLTPFWEQVLAIEAVPV